MSRKNVSKMELGSLAEWVTGLAEFIAVIVALFLPFFRERREKKQTTLHLISIGLKLAHRILKEKARAPEQDLTELADFEFFTRYVSTVTIINSEHQVFLVLTQIADLLDQVQQAELSVSQAEVQLKNLTPKKLREVKA
ncbi:hypothetical protein [Enterococcus sp. CSURQ0835]|uniref:hypothetical protein n=1 Tax=Enterococcus sp. CSURQ0835 TaxID=2681394 RepID=UPI00135897A0|nr:hypothetical protein [Enterococcus sp. CSURQ0835]